MNTSAKQFLWDTFKEFLCLVLVFLLGCLVGACNAIRYFEENPSRLTPKMKGNLTSSNMIITP